MKMFLSLTGVFFAVCIGCALAGTCLCSLFIHSALLVAGQPPASVPGGLVLAALCSSCAFAAFAAQFFMVTYTIRHPGSRFSSAAACFVWGAVAWLGIIPFCVYESDRQWTPLEIWQSEIPSRKYFRPDRDGVFFYSAVYPETETGDGIFIDLEGFTGSESRVLRIENVALDVTAARPFSDLLILKSLRNPPFLKKSFSAFDLLRLQAVKYVSAGFLSWLQFASVGLALFSLVGLRRVFKWRLLNTAAVTVGLFAVCAVNAAYHSGRYFYLSEASGLPLWLLNGVLFAICAVIGIVLAVFRVDPNREPKS